MRILYFSSDTPVELNAGYTLMFRHLSRLKEHEILILTRDDPRMCELPLPHQGIRFPERPKNFKRIANRIGSPLFWIEREANRLLKLAQPHAAAFNADVIVTVWNTAYLLAAADLSKRMSLPLVIIFHDDFEAMMPPWDKKREWGASRLKAIFQMAEARLCVSPGMADHLQDLYGSAPMEILYPIPADTDNAELPVRGNIKPLKVGFFGELGGNYGPIHAVVRSLQRIAGEFHFFSHSSGDERKQLASLGGVFDHGATDPRGLRDFFKREIDLVLIPQGFEAENLVLRRTCFPSKLAEASLMGLPLLIVAPPQGSATRWGKEYLDHHVVVETLDEGALTPALSRFQDKAFWSSQQSRVANIADQVFSPVVLQQQFENALARAARQNHPIPGL